MSVILAKSNPMTSSLPTNPVCSMSAIDALYDAPFYPSPFYASAETNFPSLFSENDVRNYLTFHKAPLALQSSKELAARKIVQVKSEERFRLFQEAAHEYLTLARLPLPPMNRAILYNQARTALNLQIQDLRGGQPERIQIEEQIKELRLQEANICLESALRTENPHDKFAFLQNGLLLLQKDANFWSALGTLALSYEKFDFKMEPFLALLKPRFECSNPRVYFAAQCFLKAGDSSIQMGHAKQAISDLSKAHKLFKEIVVEKQERAHMAEIILRVQHGLYQAQQITTLEYVKKALLTSDLYGELGEDQTLSISQRSSHLLKQSEILQDAAKVSNNCKERIALYKKALTVAKRALSVNGHALYRNPMYINELEAGHAKALRSLLKQKQQEKKSGIVKQIFSKMRSIFINSSH